MDKVSNDVTEKIVDELNGSNEKTGEELNRASENTNKESNEETEKNDKEANSTTENMDQELDSTTEKIDIETHDAPETNGKSYYSDLYKYNSIFDNQHNRRSELLSRLKARRYNLVDELRGIDDFFIDEMPDDEEMEEEIKEIIEAEEELSDEEFYYKKRENYGSKIMLSEWMVEVPQDLEDQWYFKVCPQGVRNMIVAYQGRTKAYNRKNQLKAVFQSTLPGGNARDTRDFTILDCIYRHSERTYYVLDMLVWHSLSFILCASDLRFNFLQAKLSENDICTFGSKFNFVCVDYEPAAPQTIENYFLNERELPVDGILFYHKGTNYKSGRTPLVGWLKPYMIPEKLNVPVNGFYILQKPSNYVSLEEYVARVKSYRNSKNKRKAAEMEDDVEEMPALDADDTSAIDAKEIPAVDVEEIPITDVIN